MFSRAYASDSRAPGFNLRAWPEKIAEHRLLAVTDCRSLYDQLVKQGSYPPDDRRLQLVLLDMMVSLNMVPRWVPTYQMLADALTKNMVSRYMVHVLRTSMFTRD